METPGINTVGRPIKVRIVSNYLAAGEAGRHKLYAAVLHPLRVRMDFAANQAGLPVPAVEILPEPAFWALVGSRAVEADTTETEAFLSLTELYPDITQKPAHPFLVG